MHKKYARAHKALTKIALREGKPVEQVIKEIEKAIADAHSSAMKNNDLATLEKWAAIPSEGHLPTALELITYLGNKVHNQRLS